MLFRLKRAVDGELKIGWTTGPQRLLITNSTKIRFNSSETVLGYRDIRVHGRGANGERLRTAGPAHHPN